MRNVKEGLRRLLRKRSKAVLDRVKEVDVEEYVKPLRKRWKSWMC
jgi:hypothetical protein